MLEIQKDIPLPKEIRRKREERTYPWNEMEVGDSFLVPLDQRGFRRLVSTVSACAVSAAKVRGTHYTVQRESGGVRVWRVE